ncbi:MAG: hypothetical protein IKA22_03435 [Lentisphaeria bacterium]|nr:hypothetical protein [Lentisphaeria bacterium]
MEKQIIYLDFDGAETTYNNKDLNITVNTKIHDSEMSEEQKQFILSSLRENYKDSEIYFTLEKPEEEAEFSTIFIGQSDDFDEYGSFEGLAENIDKGNKIKNDNAFVFADNTYEINSVISVIKHEIGHIIEGEEHIVKNNDLTDYAVIGGEWLEDVTLICNSNQNQYEVNGYVGYSNSSYGSGIDFRSRSVYYGARFTFENLKIWDQITLTITNTSNQNSLFLFFYDSDEKLASHQLAGEHGYTVRDQYISSPLYHVLAGETQTITFTPRDTKTQLFIGYWSSATNHDYNITRRAFYSLSINIPGTNNIPPSPAAAPDLTISSLSLSSNSIAQSDYLTIYFTVTNYGNATTQKSSVFIYNGSSYLGTCEIPLLSTGESVKKQLTIAPGTFITSKVYELNLFVDENNHILESNENNNKSSCNLTVNDNGYADLAFYTPDGWEDEVIITGGHDPGYSDLETHWDNYLKFAVKNIGNKHTTSTVWVDIFIDEEIITSSPWTTGLSINGTFTSKKALNIGPISHGTHTVKVQIRQDAAEIITSNNTYLKTIFVKPWKYEIPTIPGNPTHTIKNNNICLTWEESSDNKKVTGYEIAYCKDHNMADADVITVFNNEYSLENLFPGTYYWQVRAFDEDDIYSEWSTVDSFYIEDSTPPTTPEITSISIKEGSDSATFYWTKSTDDDQVSTYKFSYTLAEPKDKLEQITHTVYSSNNFITVDNLQTDRKYICYVQAVDPSENISAASETKYFVTGVPIFDLLPPSNPTIANAYVSNSNIFIDWSDSTDASGIAGYEIRCDLTKRLTPPGATLNTLFVSESEIAINYLPAGEYFYEVRACDKNGYYSDWTPIKYFTVSDNTNTNKPYYLYSTNSSQTWKSPENINTVEYSKNSFKNVLKINTEGNSIDTYGVSSANHQWRVGVTGTDDWSVGNSFSGNYQAAAAPEIIKSNNNGNIDLFFAKKQGIWKKSYVAKHQGIQARWIGTSETVSLLGKNKISDIFIGSNDDNILVLTDDANGDALFVDDIYTALGNQARLNKIDEIRAGAGDDIIDMTSQRFEYSNNSMSIFGGSGNDVIWGNNSSNLFFGDAGNDRIVGGLQADIIIGGSGNDQMHGGGGTDIFTFSENWGRDTVEQLVNGNVILWFESGSINNWNERTLTYKDGNNTVTVKGINADQVYLLFGNEDDMFADFASAGAFDDFISEKIFEDADKNLIA